MLLIFSRSPAFIIQSYLVGHFDFQSRLANTCAYYAFKITYYALEQCYPLCSMNQYFLSPILP